jgi:hypothetical protein
LKFVFSQKEQAMIRIFNLLAIVFLLVSCKPKHEDMVKGTIRDFTGLDGCGLVIQLDNKTLEPINLSDFSSNVSLIDGQKVWVKYQAVSGMASICMVGEIVEITGLEER